MWFGVVAALGANDLGLMKWLAAHAAANRRNRMDERHHPGDVVAVRPGQDGTDGDAICIDEDVMSGTRVATDRWGSGQFFAPMARTDDGSTAAREKSNWPASRNFASRSSCSRSHTPAFCQSRKRRQQAGPEPDPNLIGKSHQHIPVLNTNRMPFSATRSETQPGYFLRRGFGGGSKGSINAHSSSLMIGVPIPFGVFLKWCLTEPLPAPRAPIN
ncbi:hypothetical protein LMG29542_08503 [Paraburkholderia humisilvae]|uniref:Uncharacterized protein n=1 Tax=Paraburkholderia humisilvae TaxID=627669 RepID=A0A6J5FBE4_9BURK|nr:hypothetical protein LMG29542_08503 [Paraburkholderia humisilvae]